MGTFSATAGIGITPEQGQIVTQANYIDFQSSSYNAWAKQFLPEIYEQEIERYGNRTLGGFLRMVGAEMPMASDQVIWSEQNRLHIGYDDCNVTGANAITIDLPTGQDDCGVRVNDTIAVTDTASVPKVAKCLVTAVGAPSGGNVVLTVQPYNYASLTATTGAANGPGWVTTGDGTAVKIFVYGSEFVKGSNGRDEALQPKFTSFSNKPIIIKDYYEVQGSDAAQIGWIEVATEDGTSGYMWYLKAESETRLRFEDYLEMSMVESVKDAGVNTNLNANIGGTEGLFSAIETRGNVFGDATLALADFDLILKELDKQGAIEENMLFLDRSTNLEFDNMLGAVNAHFSGGSSFGLFDNDEDMALNLGFSGFRRGSYDFYKTDWKYLNDASTRGMFDDIKGVLVPAGTSTVYDQLMGQNIRRPFLHVRYRASETEDRRMKSWILGSVGGAYTSSKDVMEIHFLSERCLCVQGANNFVLIKKGS